MGAERVLGKQRRSSKRLSLEKLIPLSTPLALFIDTGNACNLKCEFCPTGHRDLLASVGRTSTLMSMDLFRQIVADLKTFEEKIGIINLYKDGDPLVNRNFTNMVRELKNADVAKKIMTKTNALLLGEGVTEDLASCGLDEIGISIIAPHSEGYRKFAKKSIDYAKLLRDVDKLYKLKGDCKIYIKMADCGFSRSEIEKFYDDFEDKCDFIAIENLHGWSNSDLMDFTLGQEKKSVDGIPLVDKVTCPWPFYEMGINSNGTVGLCNDDWAHKTIIGDLRQNTLKEIWNGQPMYEMRKMHLEGRRSENEACANCYYIKCSPDNIDEHRQEILEKIIRSHADKAAALI